ncbi:hypothetical protein DRE_04639 [Drechslerella stenobrocha 248]|uniref:Zn(2)-C6 fungal-type domain-containing protein n=1 Tax=Drechslerella stenobrocha 248 TaxID=1043628 RepID=W7IAI9_9PEZI|nr:hypothetical protein DRE_04639 [Drechslerella stenobrocha 248]
MASDSEAIGVRTVQVPPPPTTVINFQQDISVEPETSTRMRRFHHKTRTGCRECKRKRRKCNEGKPSCGGCLKSGVHCSYEETIPPKVQPKNRKRPRRKTPQNRFVFIEFGGGSQRSADLEGGGKELSRWQSAPSTCLLQGGLSLEGSDEISFEVETLCLFRNFTSRTLPFQAYGQAMWERVSFEASYSHSYLYNSIIAIAGSHQRFIRGELVPRRQETSHYMRALTDFRSAVSDPNSVTTMNTMTWISVLVTASMLGMYIMSCPIENFETSCDTFFSLSRGTMNMLIEAVKRGHRLDIPASRLKQQPPAAATPSMAEFPGLEYAARGEDGVIGEATVMRLAGILAALSGKDWRSIDTPTSLNLLKMLLEWAGQTESSLIQRFREKDKRSYIVTAHYFAGLWKVREIIWGLCRKDEWRNENGIIDGYWWMASPEGLCKKLLASLEGEPSERIDWVEGVVADLDRPSVSPHAVEGHGHVILSLTA